MRQHLIEKLEGMICSHICGTPVHGRLSDDVIRTLAPHVAKLSALFTTGRSSLESNYFSEHSLRNAYLAHFLLTNAAKVLHCLEQAFGDREIDTNKPLRVLDIGSGPGTASLAASIFFESKSHEIEMEATAVEINSTIVEEAEKLFKELGNRAHTFKAIIARASAAWVTRTLGREKFDLIIAANAVNVFVYQKERISLLRALVEVLAQDGRLIVIDPALRDTTRPLMAIRDVLLAGDIARAVAPCLHEKPCPMLAANDRDWCHFYIDWERPNLISRMDEMVGTNHEYLKMAYLILSRSDARRTTHDARQNSWRIVSSPLVSKGKCEFVLCGSSGKLLKIARLDKDASGCNGGFDTAIRGDIVKCDAKKRIGKDDVFEVVEKWKSLKPA